jgi:HTH-type transcriptional regulator/antitoxin HigA
MGALESNTFAPDYAIHPGEILEETLEARGMKKGDFATRCGLSTKTISLLINGKAPITPDTAIQFEKVLGVSAALWLNLFTNYSLFKARQEEMQELQSAIQWAKNFPLRELRKRGYISESKNEVKTVKSIFEFFGVASIDAWMRKYNSLQIAYRKSPSFQSSSFAVIAWLRVGEMIAEELDCNPFDEGLFKKALSAIRGITADNPEEFVPKMIKYCANAGVALAFVPEFPKTHLSGATCWLAKEKALIILSLRHKRDDHFWFSFFHEAGHILLHSKKEIFIDEKGTNYVLDKSQEKEADNFASNILIPEKAYRNFLEEDEISIESITEFAEELNIAPGIVVGRLQHDRRADYSWFNSLKRKFVFKKPE